MNIGFCSLAVGHSQDPAIYPGAAALSRAGRGTGFRGVDAKHNCGEHRSPPLNINGANTYQFVMSNPVDATDPSGTIAWYYWAAAGGVDILGGGPEDPLADAVDAGILGAGEAAATEDAAQLAAQQAAREAALKAAQTTARMALLAAAASNKPKAAPKAESKAGARGGSCPAASSPRPPKKGPLKGINAAEEAKRLGYNKKMPWRSHGQPVFGNGDGFVTPDVDSHSGGVWKLLDRAGRRIATLDGNGNVIGE